MRHRSQAVCDAPFPKPVSRGEILVWVPALLPLCFARIRGLAVLAACPPSLPHAGSFEIFVAACVPPPSYPC
eukprot:scaffold1277_cov253-Pinguiococcus_pyrenoidosus.AAC.49